MTKKILIFSTAYFPLVGGAEIAVKEITDRIDGFEFHMVTCFLDKKSPKEEKIGNITVHRVAGPKILFPFSGFAKAWRLNKKNRYCAIWAIMASYAGFAAMFFKLSHPETPYLLTLQEGDPIPEIKKKVRFAYPLFSKIFTKADVVQAISNYLGKWARDMGFKGSLEIIPNGVDTKRFARERSEEKPIFFAGETASNSRVGEAGFFLRANDKTKILITTSRLVKKNAVDDVIKSLKYLPDSPRRINFIVLGEGPDLETLKKIAKDEGVADKVIFLGFVGHEELPKYLAAADIFIRPSLSEGMGNSFIEAMAAGLPVIATQEGGIADFLFDSERNPDKEPTGWAVNPRDPKGIAKAVKKILDNPEQTAKTVANAKKLVLEKYDWNLIVEKMKNVFNKLCVS